MPGRLLVAYVLIGTLGTPACGGDDGAPPDDAATDGDGLDGPADEAASDGGADVDDDADAASDADTEPDADAEPDVDAEPDTDDAEDAFDAEIGEDDGPPDADPDDDSGADVEPDDAVEPADSDDADEVDVSDAEADTEDSGDPCDGGTCPPVFSDCTTRTVGMTCDALCTGLGATCAAAACSGHTFRLWRGTTACSLDLDPDGWSSQECSTQIPSLGSGTVVRCCCADTP